MLSRYLTLFCPPTHRCAYDCCSEMLDIWFHLLYTKLMDLAVAQTYDHYMCIGLIFDPPPKKMGIGKIQSSLLNLGGFKSSTSATNGVTFPA